VPKGRESGMPEEDYWNSFFDAAGVLAALELRADCGEVLEFGCGYGLFTVAAARVTSATVHALDIDPAMIEATRQRVQLANLTHVVIEQRDFLADGCGRPDNSIGYALLFNILHIEDPVALLREAGRVLRPGGKVGIIHWQFDASTPRGPSMEIRPRPGQCRAWAEQAGLQFGRFDPLECCPYHYGLIMFKPESP
jgi:SAM-dependent methyltransferase